MLGRRTRGLPLGCSALSRYGCGRSSGGSLCDGVGQPLALLLLLLLRRLPLVWRRGRVLGLQVLC